MLMLISTPMGVPSLDFHLPSCLFSEETFSMLLLFDFGEKTSADVSIDRLAVSMLDVTFSATFNYSHALAT